MTIYVAPTERPPLPTIGILSTLPEEYGADYMWHCPLGLVGVQRKQFPSDFLSSVHDGRLAREYAQMRGLDLAILLLEGREHWTTEGMLIHEYRGGNRSGWSRTQHRNYLASVQLRGIHVAYSDGVMDTLACLRDMYVWSNKPDHTSLDSRPAAKGNKWGQIRDRDYQRYFLQSLPRIGPKQAEAILNFFGKLPFQLTVSEEELTDVPGIGKITARKIMEVFK